MAARLFTESDLASYLHHEEISYEAGLAVERVVWGWLKPALGLTEKPDPVPDEVFSWAIELAAIAHENPVGLESYQLGEERAQFSVERRNRILAEVAGGGDGVATPLGCFPAAVAWPDHARAW